MPNEATFQYEHPRADRLLQFTRGGYAQSRVSQKWERTDALVEACETIMAAFNPATATGDRLDKLGSILQRPRNGADDARYQILLQIQIQMILSSQASTPAIQRIVALYTGQPPVAYSEHYPMGYRIETLAGLTSAEIDELLGLLREAKAGAYGVALATAAADGLILDHSTPLAGAGTLDHSTPVAGADTLAGVDET